MARKAESLLLFPSSPLDSSRSTRDSSLYVCWTNRAARVTAAAGLQVNFLFPLAAELQPSDSLSYLQYVVFIHRAGEARI